MFQTTRADRCFVVAATLVFILGLIATTWDFWHLQDMIYRINTLNIIGLALFCLGVLLRAIGKITLGKYYAYGLRTLPDHKLIKHGIYKHIRHPISMAAILYTIGIPLIFSSLYGFVIMLAIVPLVLYRLRLEEQMLLERFGDEYRDYMETTRKMIPFIY